MKGEEYEEYEEYGILSVLVREFDELTDPREGLRKFHKVTDILTIALCATLCGCDGWDEFQAFGEIRRSWFERFLELPKGIPSQHTFRRVIGGLDPRELTGVLEAIAEALYEATKKKDPEGESFPAVRAIDGKTVRGSFDKTLGKSPLHSVSVIDAETGLTFSQVATDDKSNEISAIPHLLDAVPVKGTIVTIDAMGCQKSISKLVVEKKADWVFTLKDNHRLQLEGVKRSFEDLLAGRLCDEVTHTFHETVDKGHGRIERRTYHAVQKLPFFDLSPDWAKLESFGMVIHERTIDDRTTRESRYYLGSIKPDAALLAHATRSHWKVEANHWILDVVFNEDASTIRKNHAPQNMAVLRRISLNMLKKPPIHARDAPSNTKNSAPLSTRISSKPSSSLSLTISQPNDSALALA